MKKTIDTIIQQKLFRLKKNKDENGKWFVRETPEDMRKHFEDIMREFICEYDLHKMFSLEA